MINIITIDGVEYETVLVPDNIKAGPPCDCCDFIKLPFCDEPCRTCVTSYIWRGIGGRRYKLRKVTDQREAQPTASEIQRNVLKEVGAMSK